MNKYLILHGLLMILIGNLGGIGYSKAIRKIIKNEGSWRVFHTASFTGGVLLIAFSSFFDKLTSSYSYSTLLLCGIILSNYLFIIGMFLAAIFGKRGIDKKDKGVINILIYCIYFFASLLSFSYLVILIYLMLVHAAT
ncbi:hypothetical protein [Xanthovirga aplysinae]|uniref:hypothetical protein n=1 Tax=Xanthovirga aplysinae TaxID=2529853 RepID=UPI0012BD5B9A|nr:hypothetical protein [Xanthovirga aplysinae]MTI33118.1 hypothetical protein [Xanthovirga aplysinae]